MAYIHLGWDNEIKLFVKNGSIIASAFLPYVTFLLFIILFAKSSFAIKSKCEHEEVEVINMYKDLKSEIEAMNGQVKQEEREKALVEG